MLWYIYLHEWLIFMVNVGKYTVPWIRHGIYNPTESTRGINGITSQLLRWSSRCKAADHLHRSLRTEVEMATCPEAAEWGLGCWSGWWFQIFLEFSSLFGEMVQSPWVVEVWFLSTPWLNLAKQAKRLKLFGFAYLVGKRSRSNFFFRVHWLSELLVCSLTEIQWRDFSDVCWLQPKKNQGKPWKTHSIYVWYTYLPIHEWLIFVVCCK